MQGGRRVGWLPVTRIPEHPATLDPEALRGEFPILHQAAKGHPLVYLDNAATTQKPRRVIDAVSRYYERDNANVHRASHTLAARATAAFEAARARAARFLGAADPGEILFTRGTTEAINLLAHAWGGSQLGPGDVILLTAMEHHSNLVPWQLVARSTGARLRFIPLDPATGGLRLNELGSLMTPEVRLLGMTHVSNVLGTENPVTELCREAARRGIVTLVDAAQGAGHLPIDVREVGCDFLACSGHKLCGPTGIGLLYGRADRLRLLPPWQGGGEMIERVEREASTYAPAPQRFEAGTPDIAGAVGLHAAMDFLEEAGRSAIGAHSRRLAGEAAEQLAGIPGLRLLPSQGPRVGVVSFTLDGVHAHDLAVYSAEAGVALRSGHHCAQPLLRDFGIESAVRASFHCYNTRGEVGRLVEVISAARRFFA